MRGRQLERTFRPFLACITAVMFLMPRRFRAWCFDCASLVPGYVGVGCRQAIGKSLLKASGTNIYFGRYCVIKYWELFEIGSNCSIHEYCYIDARGGIKLGDNVSIAHSASLLSFDHSYADERLPIRDQPLKFAPIDIAPDVWIGAGARILSGVRLESRTIVAANAVVNQCFEGKCILAGLPARIAKEIGP